jgi:hypothetical protein
MTVCENPLSRSLDLRPTRLRGSNIKWFSVAEAKMAGPGELDVSSSDEDGHEIRGSYRIAAGVIHVTLPDGTSTEAPLGPNDVAPQFAKVLLQELYRSKRGVS